MKLLLSFALLLIPALAFADPPVRDSLYVVLEQGTNAWGHGDLAGCRDGYRAALATARMKLADRSGLQKLIDDALAEDAATQDVQAGAFVLRAAIDSIRERLKAHNCACTSPADCVCGDSCACANCLTIKAKPAAAKRWREAYWSGGVITGYGPWHDGDYKGSLPVTPDQPTVLPPVAPAMSMQRLQSFRSFAGCAGST